MSNTNNSNAPNVSDSNAPSVSDSNTNNTNNSTSFKQKSSRPKSSKTNRKNKKNSFNNLMTYDPSLEDDDYNVDNGRFWENLSREKLEKDRENGDFIINPGKLNDMLDQM
ncbi:5728_t:CDS:2 [Entrophospora sp. SA101]|nr:5728_t:CDS:2 [Entrophospora sp. SA101]